MRTVQYVTKYNNGKSVCCTWKKLAAAKRESVECGRGTVLYRVETTVRTTRVRIGK